MLVALRLFRNHFFLAFLLLLSQKLVDSTLEVDLHRMSDKVDFPKFIYQTDKGDAFDFELFDERMFVLPAQKSQVKDAVPLVLLYSFLDLTFGLIYTHSYYPHIFPLLPVLLEHQLVMSHRFLTGRAPGGPDIHQKHFSSLMPQLCLPFVQYVVN